MSTTQTAGSAGQGAAPYDLSRVIDDEYDSRITPGLPPALSAHGFNVPRPEPLDEESIALVCEWLADAPKIRTPSGWYSYGLKHVAEEALGRYVANGDLIAACIRSGFIVRQVRGEPGHRMHPNAMIGISARWVKKQDAETKRRKHAGASLV